MARIALYGGSFDPVHWGHVWPVLAAREMASLDQVIYLPTAEPPHKVSQRFAAASVRFAMVELALLDQPALVVSDYEMRQGVAYTVETLEYFRQTRPDDELHLLIGLDSWRELETWRRYEELPELATILVMTRPGQELGSAEARPAALQDAVKNSRVQFLEGPEVELASRDLRRRWAAGEEPTSEQVPPLVLDYLRKYRLYR